MTLFMFAGCKKKTIEDKISPADIQKVVDVAKSNENFNKGLKDATIEIKKTPSYTSSI